MQNAKGLIKGFIFAVIVVAISVAVVYINQSVDKGSFKAAIIGIGGTTGQPGDGWSPLESVTPCTDQQQTRLQIEGSPTAYDWSVSPSGFNILRDPVSGSVADSFIGIGKEVDIVSPNAADLSTIPNTFTVNVAPTGAFTGANFVIQVSPACVSRLDFLSPDPSRPVVPVDGQVEVQQIRATLTNGVTYTYDSSYFSGLELSFIQNPGGKQVGSVIELPLEHPEITINMETGGSNVPPVHVPATLGQFVQIQRSNMIFPLLSDRVNPDSLIVLRHNYTDDAPGDYLEPNVDYILQNVPPDADPSINDAIQIISSYTGAKLWVAYSYTSDAVVNATTPLKVESTSCETLQAGIFQGRGQGFAVSDPSITPGTGSISTALDFSAITNSVVIANPSGTGASFGQQAFQIIATLNDTLVNRSELVSSANGIYELSVRKEADPAVTASNFAYAINNALGSTSPFIAYTDSTDTNKVILYSLEVGSHTNAYTCSTDGNAVAPCFTGGTDATGGEVIVDPPRPLDPTIPSGDQRLIYTRGGVGAISWRSSDESVISIDPVQDTINQEEQLGNDNILFSAALQTSDFDLPVSGYVTATNCDFQEIGSPPVQDLNTCDVVVNAPVTFNFPSVGYPITIVPTAGNPIQGTVQGTSMTGTLTGTATIDSNIGGIIQATGTLTGSVGGAAIGGVIANVTMNVNIDDFTNPSLIQNESTITSVSGTITKDTSLIPTQRTVGAESQITSTFALLNAKNEGSAIIFANDATGCAVPLEIEVTGKTLDIEFATDVPTFFEEGDTAQLRAMYDDQDVTNFVTWSVDNPDVASISSTGILSAKGSGITNVTASYDTGITEVGIVNSFDRLAVQVAQLEGLTISLDQQTVDSLSPTEKENAFANAVVAINSENALGQTITLEGNTFNVAEIAVVPPAPAPSNERERIVAIADKMEADFGTVADINVVRHPTQDGVLILTPTGSNTAIDISTTANPEDISILASVASGFVLPSTESYGLQVLGEYSNGLTKKLDTSQVTYTVNPINRLDDTALSAGRIEKGIEDGTSTIFAEVERNDGLKIKSNGLNVTVILGPTIQFARILGQEAIAQGSRINLSVKVTDDNAISDIQDIRAWIVRSAFDTYDEINSDTGAVWFDAQMFTNLVNTTESGTENVLNYRIYDVPIEVPVTALLTDGSYKLILEITDANGRIARAIVPIVIGDIVTGDVTGDGVVNMIDVITSFRIATGQITPTASQLQAGNLDDRGGISMIDVIMLFRQLTRPTN